MDAGSSDVAARAVGMDAGSEQEAGARDAGMMMAMHSGMDAAAADAGRSDAGLNDAAISDAGSDAWVGSGQLCPPHALYCDGYENADLNQTWDYYIDTNGTAARSTTLVHSGTAALHATTNAAPGGTATNEARWGKRSVFAHQTSGDVWLRYYYYVPSSTLITTFFSTGVISEIESPYFGFSLVVRNTQVDIGVGDTFYPGTMTFPRDRWVCVELHAQIAGGSAGLFEAYLDGAPAVYAPHVNTLPNMGYSSVDLGIHYTEPTQGPVEAYTDDVAAGTTRLGCVP
jgi:hypothetical protein